MNNLIRKTPTSLSRNSFPFFKDSVFHSIEQEFDQLCDQFFKTDSILSSVKANNSYPRLDVLRTDENLLIRVAVPGISDPESIFVEISPERVLSIKGQTSSDYKNENPSDYLIRELKTSKFCRVINLPEDAEGDPEAVLKDGILTLSWKLPEKAKPPEPQVKKIPIKKEE